MSDEPVNALNNDKCLACNHRRDYHGEEAVDMPGCVMIGCGCGGFEEPSHVYVGALETPPMTDVPSSAPRWLREVREAKAILDGAMTEHVSRQRDPLYRAIESAFRALPLVGEGSIAFGAPLERTAENRPLKPKEVMLRDWPPSAPTPSATPPDEAHTLWRWCYALALAGAKTQLALRNAEQREAGEEDNWPAQSEWHALVSSSHSVFLRAIRELAGVPHDEFMRYVRNERGEGFSDIAEELYAAALLPPAPPTTEPQ